VEDKIKKFLNAFDGYELAYGQAGLFLAKENGKMEGRSMTITSRMPREVIENHLLGKEYGVGIVPLRQDDTCMFGAIDLDIVGANPLKHTIAEMEQKVNTINAPLIACSTKSNGIHLYCFTSEPIPAALMITRLKEWAALLGYGNSEIFPKQSYRVSEQDVGNWINLPYFNHQNAENKRKAFNKGKFISLEEFFELVEVCRISLSEMNSYKIEDQDESFNDAPPCLQILSKLGIEEGSRNNGVYNFAVYFKQKYLDDWQDKLMEINGQVKPPLALKELETIIKSVSRKDFWYKCKEFPICQYCNKSECHKRKYGIGNSDDIEIDFENISKYISGEEVIWFAQYQGKRIKLTTDELLMQSQLQKKFVEHFNLIFTPMKPARWAAKINELLAKCTVIFENEQASRKGQFFEILDAFLSDGVSGETIDDLAKYNTCSMDGETFFRSFNLFSFLKNKRFKHTENEVWNWLKDKSAKTKKIKVAKKYINVWSISTPESFQIEDTNEEKV
jgi:hypothetical protein